MNFPKSVQSFPYVSCLSALLLASACGSGEQPRQNSASQATVAPNPAATQTAQPTLEGTWKSACLKETPLGEDPYWRIENYTFTSVRQFSFSEMRYSDSGCTAAPREAMALKGYYELRGPKTVRPEYSGSLLTSMRKKIRFEANALELTIEEPQNSAGKLFTAYIFQADALFLGQLLHVDPSESGATLTINLKRPLKR